LLLKKVKIPIVSFLHTIPLRKDARNRLHRLKILRSIVNYSTYTVSISSLGKKALVKNGSVPSKIVTIHHGALDIPYIKTSEKNKYKKSLKLENKFVISTYGLLAKSKGIQYGIEAINKVVKKNPNVVYLVSGQPHPVYIKRKGEENFYKALQDMVNKYKIEKNVKFINHFLSQEEIENLLLASDVFLLPYLSKDQISSGILANAIAGGCCVISTPFPYATEIIGKEGQRGFYIDFANPDSIAKKISYLIKNKKMIESARKNAYVLGRSFTWQKMAEEVTGVFGKAVNKKS